MNQTSAEEFDRFNVTHPANFLLSVTYGTIGAIGMPGNVLLMALILSEYQKKKPYEWLIFLLALGDFTFCLLLSSMQAPFITNFNSLGCKIAGPITYTFAILCPMVPPLVACNRYLSLYNRQLCDKMFTNRSVFITWATLLTFCALFFLPFILSGSVGQDSFGACGVQDKNQLLVGLLSTVSIFVAQFNGLLVYFSYKVIMKIRNHQQQAAFRSQLESHLMKESKEIIYAMLIVSITPFFTQTPGTVLNIIGMHGFRINPWITRMAVTPFPLPSAANGYITIYIIREYRKKVAKMLRKARGNAVAPDLVFAGAPSSRTRPSRQNELARN